MKLLASVMLFIAFILVGCSSDTGETMTLLDEKVAEVNVSPSKGFGGMNENYMHSFKDEQSITIFEKAMTTAVKQAGKVDRTTPDYDVMVEYEAANSDGGFPTHGIHLWLGKENEKSTFMYIADSVIYLTSPEMTNEL